MSCSCVLHKGLLFNLRGTSFSSRTTSASLLSSVAITPAPPTSGFGTRARTSQPPRGRPAHCQLTPLLRCSCRIETNSADGAWYEKRQVDSAQLERRRHQTKGCNLLVLMVLCQEPDWMTTRESTPECSHVRRMALFLRAVSRCRQAKSCSEYNIVVYLLLNT